MSPRITDIRIWHLRLTFYDLWAKEYRVFPLRDSLSWRGERLPWWR